jgi:membrane fusion protein (multidrug efflux system)
LKPERAGDQAAVAQHTAEDTAHKDKGPKWLALQKKVQMGQTIGGNVIILSGISDGDKIVVDGVQSLHDGSRVQLGGPKPATDSTGTKKEGKEGHKPHA